MEKYLFYFLILNSPLKIKYCYVKSVFKLISPLQVKQCVLEIPVLKSLQGFKDSKNSKSKVVLTKLFLNVETCENVLESYKIFRVHLKNSNHPKTLLRDKFCQNGPSKNPKYLLWTKDIHIEFSKQFKWNLYFYVSGQSGLFWAVLKLLWNSNMKF